MTLSFTSPLLPRRQLVIWRTLQVVVWAIGLGIFVALIVAPEIGLHAFWNVLIPVAPALVALAPGLWRNVCPLGSTALLGRHMGWTGQRRLSVAWQGRLGLIGVGLLFLIVPLRHVILDTSGPATALTLALTALVAVVVSSQFRWKSAWCSGMCPVHPVEKLYGSAPMASFDNAHCHECEACVVPCPDSLEAVTPVTAKGSGARWLVGVIMVGAFPGFVWGWFHVPDYHGFEGWSHLGSIYGVPIAAASVTLAAYGVAVGLVRETQLRLVRRIFAASAIACYYWYRLPGVFGFGLTKDGMLVDLEGVLPAWFPIASRVITTVFFVWWLVGRVGVQRTWLTRPPRRWAPIATT